MSVDDIRVWKISRSGDLVEEHAVKASSLDAITRQLPQGLYTTFRTYAGGSRVMGLEFHLSRLQDASYKVGLLRSDLRQKMRYLIKKYKKDVRLRVIFCENGEYFVIIEPFHEFAQEIYQNGVQVFTTEIQRLSPQIKSTGFINVSTTVRRQLATGSKYHEALLVRDAHVLEGLTSNFFYVHGSNLGTAKQDVLPGVTRRTVLDLAKRAQVSISYRALQLDQITRIAEAFITSSSRGIVPVVKIDALIVGAGIPGSVTKMLSDLYRKYVREYSEVI